jgi:hypothetical protein
MTVYVDDMRAPFSGMIMCHMTADSREELLAFALELGLKESWKQSWDSHRFHFDISLSKRKLAIAQGAMEVTWKEFGKLIADRRLV